MWTIHSEIKHGYPLYSTRLIVSVDEVKPFLYIDDVYEHVASLPDFLIYPEDTGDIHRTNSVDLVFRTAQDAYNIQLKMEADIRLLENVSSSVYEVTDEILYTNEDRSSSSSESSSSESSSSI